MPFTVLDPSTAEAAPVTSIGAPGSDGMQLQDIREEILLDLQGRTDIVVGDDYTRLDRWINWGYLNMCQLLDIKELWASLAITTVADQPLYTMPAALAWIKKVVVDDPTEFVLLGGEELAEIDLDTYRGLPDSDEVDFTPLLPQSWFRYQRMAVLWPTPDAAYDLAIDCRIRPLPLTDPQDCPLLPEEFHEAIVYSALARAWRALRNPQAAAIAQNDALMVIRPLINTDAEERTAMHAGFAPARSRADLYRGRI